MKKSPIFLTKTLLTIMAATLTGCAFSPLGQVADGGAIYRYEKTPDSCKIEITSSRDVSGGQILIDENCAMATKTESAVGGDALQILKDMAGSLR